MEKVSLVLPVSRTAVLDCKYVLYLLLIGIGLLLGVILGVVASIIKGQIDYQSMMLFVGISVAMALFSGSMTIPLTFLLSEEKKYVGFNHCVPSFRFRICRSCATN